MASPLRVGVVGVGYFGQFHAKHYAANKTADLVAIVDADETRAGQVAKKYRAEAHRDHRALAGRVDAVSIAAPTPLHFELARDCLEAGIHVLVEKPVTDTVESAEALVALAERKGLVLQVGHIERYSAPFRALAERITRPLFIESYRISPWTDRANEVDVVLDLMIHDIDIIQGLVDSAVASVHAVGAPVANPTEDLANARIMFENGCVANVTASRISMKTERKIRIFQPFSYISCDFVKSHMASYSHSGAPGGKALDAIKPEFLNVPKEDSLANEIADFLDCIRTGRAPRVGGRAGVEALRLASLINDNVRDHRRQVEALLAQ